MLLSKNKKIIQKSKFLAYFYEIENYEEYEEILKLLLKKHKKAKHICSAIKIKDFEKFKNDSEVGSPGKILLKILNDKSLNKHSIIVIRYFGGIKLGIGGVQRAFRSIGIETVENYIK